MNDKEKIARPDVAECETLRLKYEQMRQELERIRSLEERFRAFVENATEGFVEYDLEGRCRFCNQAAHDLIGCTREEFMSKAFGDLFAGGEQDKSVEALKTMHETAQPIEGLFRLPGRDGLLKTIDCSILPMWDAVGKPSGFRLIVRDVTDLRKAQEEHERYRNFVDHLDDGCYEFDLEGNIIFCNEGLPRIFGYSRDEFIKLSRYERHISRESAKSVFRMYVEMYKHNIPSKILEYKIRRKDGDIRDFEVSVSLIRDNGGQITGYRGIARDITDRKILERERERYREFVEKIDDVCAEYDLKGRCTFCNDAACRLFGYPRSTLLQMRHHDRYPSVQEADKVYDAVHETYVKNLPVKYIDAQVLCKDGKVKMLETSISLIRDAQGEPIGFRSVARDVTQRRKMERDLARYRDFVENIEDGCAEFDLRGRCIFCNGAAHRMLGYSRHEFMQLRLSQRHATAEECQRVYQAFSEVYRTQKPARVSMFAVRCKDGSTKAVESSVTLIRDANGTPVGFRSIARDVTTRLQMEREQAQLREQLSQARKMEAIGTLAGGVAHDFNNLLMGIQGYTSLLLLDTDSRHPHYAQLKAIEAHVKSGSDLTKQLLGYARGGRYEVRPLCLNDMIEKTARMFARTKKEIVLRLSLAENLWSVDADRGQLEQALLNLLVNAWQAMPDGGDIHIRTANVLLEASQVRGLDISPGPYVQMTVTDTGVGMDQATRERLFEPFFTTKERGTVRGTGLGLASVYGTVKGHKGAIDVQSEKGQGATFNVYLPASFHEAVQEKEPDAVALCGHETILLVDDEKGVVDVVGEMIKKLGYRVMTAESGQKAVDLYRMLGDQIDLVIVDMIMPGMGGAAVVDFIRRIHPRAKIILSSGYSLNEDAQDLLRREPGIRFIQKPFQLADLSKTIRWVLDGSPGP
jgi:PAS domain S-box-containing protein